MIIISVLAMKAKTKYYRAQSLRDSISFVLDGKTELWYLQLLKEHHHIPVHFSPELPQDKSLEELFELVKRNADDYSKVFWVLDLDVVIRESRQYKGTDDKRPVNLLKKYIEELKSKSNVFIIINTPGFEYWVLLHFRQTKRYYETCDHVIYEIHKEKGMEGYDKSEKFFKNPRNNIYQRLLPNVVQAIKNSRATGELDFDNVEVGLSQMCILFDELNLFHKPQSVSTPICSLP